MEKIITDKIGQFCQIINNQKVVIKKPYFKGPFHNLCGLLVEDNLQLVSVGFYPVETAAIYRHKGGQILYLYGKMEEFQTFPKLFKDLAARKAREEAERKAREEAERKAREEAERKAPQIAREEAERKAPQIAREEAERKAQMGKFYPLCKDVVKSCFGGFSNPIKNPALPYYRRHTKGQLVFAQEVVDYVELGVIPPSPTKKFKKIVMK